MQKTESVINDVNAALAVARRLGVGEAGSSGVIDTAKFAVEIRGLRVEVRQRGDDAWIFGPPIEPGPGQQLPVSIVDERSHAKAVQFYLMQPLRTRGRFLDRLGSWGGMKRGRGVATFGLRETD